MKESWEDRFFRKAGVALAMISFAGAYAWILGASSSLTQKCQLGPEVNALPMAMQKPICSTNSVAFASALQTAPIQSNSRALSSIRSTK